MIYKSTPVPTVFFVKVYALLLLFGKLNSELFKLCSVNG